MARTKSIKLWVGDDDDSKIPDRVRNRVRERYANTCASCSSPVRYGGEIDHVIALKNWNDTPEAPHGNRETNLQLLCKPCHSQKTNRDVAEKSKIYQIQKKLGGLRKERSRWSRKLEEFKYDWSMGKYKKKP